MDILTHSCVFFQEADTTEADISEELIIAFVLRGTHRIVQDGGFHPVIHDWVGYIVQNGCVAPVVDHGAKRLVLALKHVGATLHLKLHLHSVEALQVIQSHGAVDHIRRRR